MKNVTMHDDKVPELAGKKTKTKTAKMAATCVTPRLVTKETNRKRMNGRKSPTFICYVCTNINR